MDQDLIEDLAGLAGRLADASGPIIRAAHRDGFAAEAKDDGFDVRQRGATWTYLTTDQPFGSGAQRIFRGLVRKVKSRRFWG